MTDQTDQLYEPPGHESEVIDAEPQNTAMAKHGAEPDLPAPSDPFQLMARVAMDPNADVTKLERLMDMQERWEANNARKAFFDAMARFQSAVPAIPKRGEVYDKSGKLMYRFAKLEDLLNIIANAEHDCGFRHRWDQEDLEGGGVRITCEISHIAGHCERSSVTIPPTKGMNTNAAQDRGVIIKYGKRYSLLNAYGLEPDDDTDATLGDRGTTITDDQAAELNAMLDQLPEDDRRRFYEWAGVESVSDLPAAKYDAAKRGITNKTPRVSEEEAQTIRDMLQEAPEKARTTFEQSVGDPANLTPEKYRKWKAWIKKQMEARHA